LQLDVSSPPEIASVVAAAIEKFGRLDVLINNAGYGLAGDFEATTDADARKQLETNFWGPVNLTKEALRVFREVNPNGEGGTVVQISSMGGYMGFPGNAFYHARFVFLAVLDIYFLSQRT
jgi:NAD(P)-dependent dehydrogenase (short-subunit alcohol dehydrogenase family)